jgi:hypothetical protein
MFLNVPSDVGADLLYFDVDGSGLADGPHFVVGILFPNQRTKAPATTEELLTWFKFNPSASATWDFLSAVARTGLLPWDKSGPL